MRKLENPTSPLDVLFLSSVTIVVISLLLVGVKNIEAESF
jgi:hypothetical protein